jgi:hypothetical protein
VDNAICNRSVERCVKPCEKAVWTVEDFDGWSGCAALCKVAQLGCFLFERSQESMYLFTPLGFWVIVEALFDVVCSCWRAEDKVCNVCEAEREVFV